MPFPAASRPFTSMPQAGAAGVRLSLRSNGLQHCYERHEKVIDAFFDLAGTIITVRSLIRQSQILYRQGTRLAKRQGRRG
jgi:hypothetical protein